MSSTLQLHARVTLLRAAHTNYPKKHFRAVHIVNCPIVLNNRQMYTGGHCTVKSAHNSAPPHIGTSNRHSQAQAVCWQWGTVSSSTPQVPLVQTLTRHKMIGLLLLEVQECKDCHVSSGANFLVIDHPV